MLGLKIQGAKKSFERDTNDQLPDLPENLADAFRRLPVCWKWSLIVDQMLYAYKETKCESGYVTAFCGKNLDDSIASKKKYLEMHVDISTDKFFADLRDELTLMLNGSLASKYRCLSILNGRCYYLALNMEKRLSDLAMIELEDLNNCKTKFILSGAEASQGSGRTSPEPSNSEVDLSI